MRLTRRLDVSFKWYDFWVGAFYDRGRRRLYLCLIPTVCIEIELSRKV